MPPRQNGRSQPRLTAEQYVRLRADAGARVVRRRDGWLVTCPAHDDGEPSLAISTGRAQPVVLHCFAGCCTEDVLACDGLTLADVCDSDSVVGSQTERRQQAAPSIEQLAYLRIRSSRSDSSADYCTTPYVLFWVRFARATTQLMVGIDPTGNRKAVEEERFGGGELMVRMPARAGKNMRAVLEDLVDLANERLAGGQRCEPIAYGRNMGNERLGIRPCEISKALKALESHGVVERVGRLPSEGFLKCEAAGAWTWRLVVVPAIDPSEDQSEGPASHQLVGAGV